MEKDNSNNHNLSHEKSKHWYDRYYKILLFIPIVVMILSVIYLVSFYSSNHDIIRKDPSLSGGTTITVKTDIDSSLIENKIKEKIDDAYVRTISDLSTGKQLAVLIDSSREPDQIVPIVEEVIGFKLNADNSSVEFSGPSLGSNFYNQLLIAATISFILMSLVIFLLFKTFIPSMAVIFAAFSDIVMTLAVVDFFGFRISSAGIAAFLTLIGYSVDTDILLTSRVLKSKGQTINSRIYGAFRTGIFMTLTGLAAVIPAFFIITGLPDSFKQIFLIIAIGLGFDIINTWLTNASIIKWYAERKRLA